MNSVITRTSMKKLLQLAPLLVLCQTIGAQDTDGDAERGAALYHDFACYACHGYNATGRTPLSRETSGVLSDESLFIRYLRLRADQNPVNPKNSMPNYDARTLSDAKASDIYAYILSLQDDPPEIEDVPVLRQIIEDAQRRNSIDPNDE